MKKHAVSIMKVTVLVMALFATAYAWADCRTSCSGDGEVQVDLAAKCMCIGKDSCFEVNIGKDGPKMTTQGHGKIGDARGDTYSTKSTSSTGYDRDALDTGIPENTEVGKWIHKTSACGPGGQNATAGCIAVPCEHWPEVKAQKGKTLDVCGGNAPMSRNGGSGDSGGGSGQRDGGGR